MKQADTFASAFLIDQTKIAKYATVMQVSEAFGVSLEAAQVRFKIQDSRTVLIGAIRHQRESDYH